MSAHDFEFQAIDGGALPLSRFAGKALLVVNTASECGFTPQYAGLQALWERYRDRGLVVLGVPSNDFGEQEPGTDGQIRAFCSARFGVSFPLAARTPVIGGQAHPLYRWVVEEVGEAAAPRWNFHKYLFDAEGNLVELWPSRVEPEAEELTRAIEAVLPG